MQFYQAEPASTLSDHQHRLIYCNGIESTSDNAIAQATMISKAFGDRAVTVVHNPTKVAGYYNHHLPTHIDEKTAIINSLIQEIRSQMDLETGRQHPIAVFAHSHGAHILHQALLQLSDKERDLMSVYTFGGVTTIPNKLANRVCIYFNEGDLIGRGGNIAYGVDKTMDRFLAIHDRMKRDGSTRERAILEQVKEDLYFDLEPHSHPSAIADTKIAIFGSTFFGGVVYDRNDLKARIQSYTECFKDYNIHLIASRVKENNLAVSDGLDDNVLASIAQEELLTYVLKHDLECHRMTAFQSQIEQIALDTLQMENAKAETDVDSTSLVLTRVEN